MNGHCRFAEFLAKNHITMSAAARALGVEVPTVYDWRKGSKRPRYEHRLAIEVWTGGELPADIWRSQEEIDVVERVTPYVPESGLVLPSTDDSTGTDGKA